MIIISNIIFIVIIIILNTINIKLASAINMNGKVPLSPVLMHTLYFLIYYYL